MKYENKHNKVIKFILLQPLAILLFCVSPVIWEPLALLVLVGVGIVGIVLLGKALGRRENRTRLISFLQYLLIVPITLCLFWLSWGLLLWSLPYAYQSLDETPGYGYIVLFAPPFLSLWSTGWFARLHFWPFQAVRNVEPSR